MIIREIKRGQRGGVKRKDNKERSFQYQFVVAVFSMLGFSNTTKTVIVLSVVIVLIILLNISYILYHLYMNKHCEVLVSCSGQKIQEQEPSGTACKHGSYCNCMQATVTACKLL